MQQTNFIPVTVQERIRTIDIIRGVALMGILIINFTVDNRAVTPSDGWSGFWDQLAYWPIKFFLDDRFMAIYCILFGLGFAIQMQRAESRNSPFLSVYIRRLIALYFIGVVLEILTQGSIIHDYAIVGVLLLPLHKLPVKVLPVLALLCVLVSWSFNLVVELQNENRLSGRAGTVVDTARLDACVGVYEREGQPGRYNVITREGNKVFSQGRSGVARLLAISETEFVVEGTSDTFSFLKDSTGKVNKLVIHPANGVAVSGLRIEEDIEEARVEMNKQMTSNANSGVTTYRQFVVKSAEEFWYKLKNWSWRNFIRGFHISKVLPLFLIGLYFGRRKIFVDVSAHSQFLRNVLKYGLLIGVPAVGIGLGFEVWNFINDVKWKSYPAMTRSLMDLSWNAGAMLMAVAYVAGLTLLLENTSWRKRLSFLSSVGRMGLTNYILQAIFFALIFSGFGLALTGKIGPFWRLMLALPFLPLITFVSRWWFNRFRIGPAEWLWRSLTYWEVQPIRRTPTTEKEAEYLEESVGNEK